MLTQKIKNKKSHHTHFEKASPHVQSACDEASIILKCYNNKLYS